MKRLLLLLLCLPLLYTAARQGYGLAVWEFGGQSGAPSATPKDGPKAADLAKKTAEEMAKLHETAILVDGNEKAVVPVDGKLKDLASALDHHRESLHDAKHNFIVLTKTDDRDKLQGDFRELLKLVGNVEIKFVSFKEAIKKGGTSPIALADLQAKMRDCQKELMSVKKENPHAAHIAERKLSFLEDAANVLKVMGEKDNWKNWENHFRTLEGIAVADAAGDLTPLIRSLAIQKAKELYLSEKDLPLDDNIEVRPKKGDWVAFDLSEMLTETKPFIYITIDRVELKARSITQFNKDGKLYFRIKYDTPLDFEEPNEGQKGYMNRIRPTRKSVAAHAYNCALTRMREAANLNDCEQFLWEEYRKCAAKNKDLAKEIEKKPPSFAVDELKAAKYPAGARLETLAQVVRACPKLFNPDP